jgi:micrococcal nuclease
MGDKEDVRLRYVLDGDTIHVSGPRGEARVRLIGMDTPECHPGPQLDRQSDYFGAEPEDVLAAGRAAKAHLFEMLGGTGAFLTLEYDRVVEDRYGRMLAYVWMRDGRMANREMIREGYAVPCSFPPNGWQTKDGKELYREARQEGRGLWRQHRSILDAFFRLLSGRTSARPIRPKEVAGHTPPPQNARTPRFPDDFDGPER